MLHGFYVDLSAMLAAREARALLQRDLLARFHVPLLSYTLNIPGPVKTSAVIRRAFDAGLDALAAALAERNIPCIAREERHEATGDEAILALRGGPEAGRRRTAHAAAATASHSCRKWSNASSARTMKCLRPRERHTAQQSFRRIIPRLNKKEPLRTEFQIASVQSGSFMIC